MKAFNTIILLTLSNLFMTLAWYGHLKFKDIHWLKGAGLFTVILISWGIAFFEYCLQVPANRIGHESYGGPFNVWQLKVIQEVITLIVFAAFSLYVFKQGITINHLLGCACLILAVYFFFK